MVTIAPDDLLADKPSVEQQAREGTVFARSAVGSLLGYGATLTAGLFFTPYLLRTLGAAAYGFVPLVNSLVGYLSLVTLALNATLGRYVLIALEQKDRDKARRLVSTAVAASFAVAGGLSLVVLLASSNMEAFVAVPAALLRQAQILFALVGMSFLVAEVRTPFEVGYFCSHRLDVRSYVGVAETAVRLAGTVALFSILGPNLALVGCATFASMAVSLLIAMLYLRRSFPELKPAVRHFDWHTLRSLSSDGLWVSVGQVGTLLLLGVDLVVVNRLVGIEDAGRYAAIVQWSAVLRGISGAVSVSFGPAITRLYAARDTRGLVAYCRTATRVGSMAIAIPVGVLCGYSAPLLGTWLGPGFRALSPLLCLLIFHLVFNLAFVPLINIPFAMGRVRLMGLVQVLAGGFNLAVACALSGPARLGVAGVAVAGFLTLTAKNALFTSLYAAKLLGARPTTFLLDAFPAVIVAAVVYGCSRLVAGFVPLATLGAVAGTGIVTSCVGAALGLLALPTTDRTFLLASVGRRCSMRPAWFWRSYLR